jgi:hypothetical protein
MSLAATCAALLALASPGDRLFAKKATLLVRQPSMNAPPIRGLLAGDELVEGEVPEDELRHTRVPVGWVPVQTVDVPSERSYLGWVKATEVTSTPPLPERRTATLHQALTQALDELEQRQKPFADLRDQVLAWREKAKTDTAAQAEVQKLANQLAHYMEAEVTPRAMDIQDALAELKELGDPSQSVYAVRFGKLALGFQP